MRSPLLTWIAGGVLPVQLVFAIFLLLRGHDEPGGGFVAGLVTACAAALAALAFGRAPVQRALAPLLRPLPWIGLTLAALSGLVAVARGQSFLTHARVRAALALDLSTTLLFDTGVFLVVVATGVMILGAFAEGPSS